MKFIAIALTLALSQASANSISAMRASNNSNAQARNNNNLSGNSRKADAFEEDACNTRFEFQFANDGCDCDVDLDEIKAEIQEQFDASGCSLDPAEFLKHHIRAAEVTDDELTAFLTRLCHGAHHKQIENATPFGEITEEGALFDKEYYDGGTYYNEERETNEYPGTDDEPAFVLQDHPGEDIKDFYDTEAQSWNVEFPSYMTNFDECQYNVAMCCFVQDRQANDNNGNCATPYDENCVDADPADNTDICYADAGRAPGSTRVQDGFAIFAGDDDDGEGAAHCHGLAWADEDTHPSSMYKGNNLFYISMYDHLYTRGYVRNVPGAPMCSCLEQAPVVSRSDCTEITCNTETLRFRYKNNKIRVRVVEDSVDIEFNACQGANDNNNDLYAYYQRLVDEGLVEDQTAEVEQHIVGNDQCPDAIEGFLTERLGELGININ